MSLKMPFGKFRGVLVADLPDEYLAWLHGLAELRDPLKTAVEEEYRFRFSPSSSTPSLSADARKMAEEILSAGYRKLAQQHHPDHGGDGRTMQLVNEAGEFLRQAVRQGGNKRA